MVTLRYFGWTTAVGCLALVAGSAVAQTPCPSLPAPAGTIVVVAPADADILRSIVAGAAAGTTILLEDGAYDMSGGDFSHRLEFTTPDLTLRSASGDREAVVLDGGYATSELISIQASGTVIADLTLKRADDHPIHISGPGVPISGVLIHNVHIVDPGQQAVKVNPIGAGTVDNSTLRCSFIELTDAGRAHIRDNCYTGGFDAHAATGWLVFRNRVEGFWCDEGLSEHGIHLWRQSAATVVEDNVVLDCARGIGFGLGAGVDGHDGGVISNNFVAASDAGLFASEYGFDSGIVLWGAEGAEVYHNSVASIQPPFSSIEWRYIMTSVTIANNLTTAGIVDRGGTAVLMTNLTNVATSLFEDVAAGDLHLVDQGSSPVGAATPLPPGTCDLDFDGIRRDSPPDIGADEYGLPLFNDGFEFGTTNAWSATSA
jgi:hypothetical protein